MTQNQQILKHLQKGHWINPIQALNKFGCFRLARVINELRANYEIERQMVKKGKKSYARYRLV